MNSKAFVFVGLGFELVGAVLVCLWIGSQIDAKIQTNGLAAALGCVVAFAGWIVHLLIVVKSLAKNSGSKET